MFAEKNLFINLYNFLMRLPVLFMKEKNMFVILHNLLLKLLVVFYKEAEVFHKPLQYPLQYQLVCL